MDRVTRLVGTLLLLQSRRLVRAEDIAGHFGISVRTVYRDLKALEECGVPLVAEVGRGYSFVDGYHLPPVMFTREEAGALFIGGEFAERLTDLSLKGHVRSALLKIRAVLPLEEKGYLERLQESTAVITRNDLSDRELGQCLATLQDAVVHRKGGRIIYHTNYRDSIEEREIEPLGLVYYGDNWHLIAFCRLRHDIRDFRLDRVQHLELTGETFPERRGFSLREYLADANRSAGLEEVRVRFTREAARHTNARHMFGFIEQTETPDGVEMLFFTSSLQWIAQWILSYGTNAVALYPEELRCLTHSLALAVAGQYGAAEPASSLHEMG